MKRKYEYNFYEPYQYEDLQEHLERMATRGWILERMDPHFLVYRRGGPGLIRYALAYHPEVADMDSSRLPRLEDYAYLCRRAGWELVGRWAKYPQIQVYAAHQADPIPLQTDLRTQWSVLVKWMERRYQPNADIHSVVITLFLAFYLLYFTLLVRQGDLSPLLKLLAAGAAVLALLLMARQIVKTVSLQNWLTAARRAMEEGAPGPGGQPSQLLRFLTGLTLLWTSAVAVLALLWTLNRNWVLAAGTLLWLLALTGVVWLAGKLHSWLRERQTAAVLKWSVFLLAVVPVVLLLVVFYNRWLFARLPL